MHYYKRNIGDYYKKAGRLTMLQHGAYTQLIDACYDRELFPTLDDAIEWTWASTEEEIAAVKFVLKRFFTLEDGVYSQLRIKEEIEKYKKNGEINRKIALEREAKKRAKKTKGDKSSTNRDSDSTNRDDSVNEPSTVEHERAPNQEPRTKNQEPLKEHMAHAGHKPSDYPKEFEWIWKHKPPREGGNPKKQAYSACKARIKQGATWHELADGLKRYAMYCHATGILNTRMVQQMSTFFGTKESFKETWAVNHEANNPGNATGGSNSKANAIEANNQQLLEQYGHTAPHGERAINPIADPGMDSHEVPGGLHPQMGVQGITIDMDAGDLSYDSGSDTQGGI